MKKQFVYPKGKIIYPNINFLFIPLCALVFLPLIAPPKTKADLIVLTLLLLLVSIFILKTLWIADKLMTVIEVEEQGITYKSLFKNMMIKWHEILNVERKLSYEKYKFLKIDYAYKQFMTRKTFPEPDIPFKELTIKTKNNKIIKILHFLKSSDSFAKGIDALEAEIRRYTNIEFNTVE